MSLALACRTLLLRGKNTRVVGPPGKVGKGEKKEVVVEMKENNRKDKETTKS